MQDRGVKCEFCVNTYEGGKMKLRSVISLAAAVFAVVGSLPVMAQAQQSGNNSGSGGIEEITVTAQKREESLQKVPIAMSALTKGMMENMGVTDLTNLVQAVPSFGYSFSFSNPQFTLRGITNYSNGAWIESGINLYIDGVYSSNNQASIFSFNNIERIEVIKGPQGTLFGRNSLGGVVSITTKAPQKDPTGDAEIGYNDFGSVSGKFYGSTGISDNLSADLAIYAYDQSDGWGTNLYDNSELHTGNEKAIRSKWLYTPSDLTTITFSADYDYSEPPIIGTAFINGVYPFVPIGPEHVGGYWDSYLPQPGLLNIKRYGGSITVDHAFAWGQLVSISAMNYSKIEKDASRPPALPYDPDNPSQNQGTSGYSLNSLQINDTKTFTQEFQLKSPGGAALQWIAGIFFLDDKIDNEAHRVSASGSSRYVIDDQKTQSYAAFGQMTMPVATDTRLTLGLRYTKDHKEVDGYGYNADGSIRPQDSITSNPEPSKSWSEPTYTTILDHDFSDEIMGYASYSHGYQSGSYNISSSVDSPPVDPQTIDAFEVGLKSSALDNRLRLNTSVYYYKIHDLLVSQNINNTRVTANAAEAKYEGVDLDVTYLPIDNLMLTLALSYVNPEYSDYRDATFYKIDPAGSGTWVNTVGDATGYQIAYSEQFSGTFAANYVIPTQSGDVSLNLSVNQHSGTHYDAQGLLVQPDYAVVNSSIKWMSSDARWSARLWGNNLSNEKYATFFANTPQMYMNPAPPRTYGVSVSYHWD
jgi:iron complex outermembrane recepter protein